MTQENTSCGLGRRKNAVARVRVCKGTGRVLVNGKSVEEYFPTEQSRQKAIQALETAEVKETYDVVARLTGGGFQGQAGAMLLGMTRALAKADPSLEAVLRKEGFFTRDPRMRERLKYGQKGARARYQFSKR